MDIVCLNTFECKDVIQSAGMLMASACLAQAMPPLEALMAAGFPEAAAREALQRVCGPSNPDHEPNPKPILLCAAELLAAESVQPDAASLARMLAAAAESNQAGQPEKAGGSGRRSAAGAKRGSPGSSQRSKEEEAERRCACAQNVRTVVRLALTGRRAAGAKHSSPHAQRWAGRHTAVECPEGPSRD